MEEKGTVMGMSDFISRSALIEDLRWLKSVVNESSKNEVQDFIDRVENFPGVNEWIPVAERLPERSGFYLVCTVHEFYKTAKMAKAHFRSGGFYGQGGHWSNVTHWMPLPELPKGVE